jgi:DNA-binding NarL/FixJ family response regulator
MHTGEQFILNCMQAGGMGLLSKNSTSSELRSAIRAVYEGEEFYSSKISREYIEELRAQLDGYTAAEVVDVDFDERERKVLRLVAEGKKSAEIAEKLQIGKRTIDWVRSRLMSKLALESSAELVQFAVKYISGIYGSRTDERKTDA